MIEFTDENGECVIVRPESVDAITPGHPTPDGTPCCYLEFRSGRITKVQGTVREVRAHLTNR